MSGYSGEGGYAASAMFSSPKGVHVLSFDPWVEVWISDTGNHRIRNILPTGVTYTQAGTGTAGYNADGIVAKQSRQSSPTGVAFDEDHQWYIADQLNHRVRRVMR